MLLEKDYLFPDLFFLELLLGLSYGGKKALKPSINQNLNRPLTKTLRGFPGKGVLINTNF